MLIEFSVTNYRSIRDRQTLSLLAHATDHQLIRNLDPGGGDVGPLLKSAVIYGPNAAGKSNVLRALQTLQWLVVQSAVSVQQGQGLGVTPFLFDPVTASQPSEFNLVFTIGEVRYDYLCAVSAERVHREWLVAYPNGRPQRWFEREYKTDSDTYEWWFGPYFKGERTERKVWQEFTRANALFLSTAVQLNNDQLKPMFHWIQNQLIVLNTFAAMNQGLSFELLRSAEGQAVLMEYMRAGDIGIERMELVEEEISGSPIELTPGSGLQIQMTPGGGPPVQRRLRVRSWHQQSGTAETIALDIAEESEGTRKLFEFAGGWARALKTGSTLFVDELDRSLHPHLVRYLVGLFHGEQNQGNAQLVFTTHDTSLLDADLLRRDQIWFVEKDAAQATRLYPFLEYRPRKDEAWERGYLHGRYGAVPRIGRLTV